MLLRKITALLLVIIMLFSFSVALAEDEYSFDSENYTDYSGYINSGSGGKPDPGAGMGNNTLVIYDNVHVNTAGQYILSVKLIGVYGKNSSVTVFYDGVEVMEKKLSPTESGISVELGEIGLEEGNNSLAFKFTNTESVYLTEFSLKKISPRMQYIFNADNAEKLSAEGVTNNKPSDGMNSGSYAEYNVDISENGSYFISLNGATIENVKTGIKLFVDGEPSEIMYIYGEGWDKEVSSELFCINLNKGTHNIKIQVANDAMRLFSLSLAGVPEETTVSFMEAISEASSVKTLEKVFEKYEGKLVKSYSELSAKLLYKDFCYGRILNIGTLDFSEFDRKATSFIKEENESPLVSFYSGGENISELPDGAFDVLIAPKFDKKAIMIVALYEKGGEKLSSVRLAEILPFEKTFVEEIQSKGDEEIRVIFLDSLKSLRPSELPFENNCIFVSPTGDDDANGTFLNPIKTIDEAVSRVRLQKNGNVSVNFMPGEYFVSKALELNENDGGKDGKKVIYKSYDKEAPAVISGGKEISGWSPYENGIYFAETRINQDIRQLYIDGFPAQRARSDSVFYASGSWDDTATVYEEDGFVVDSSNFPELINPSDAEICYNILWTLQRLPVCGITRSENRYTVKMDQPYYSEAVTMICEGGVQPTPGMQFFVENDLSLLDSPGEFYFDKNSGKIYYYPFPEENLNEVRCFASVTEKLIKAKGSSLESKIKNISFENLVFRYGAYLEVNTKGTTSFQAECLAGSNTGINQVDSGAARRLPAQLEFSNAENISFIGCDISCMGSTALCFGDGVVNSYIEGSLFRDNGGSAISIGSFNHTSKSDPNTLAENITVKNNIITRPGTDFMFCPAVSVYYSRGINILNNDISDTPYSGISLGWGWGSKVSEALDCKNHVIKNNKIANISRAVRDGGHIYMLGGMENTLVSENFISESSDYGGIYFDSGSGGITAEENVCEKCINWIFGGGTSTFVNVKVNYTDESGYDFSESTERNVTFTKPTVYPQSQWEGKALEIYKKSGIGSYDFLYSFPDLPEWRKNSVFNIPVSEKLMAGEIIIEAEDYSGFFTTSEKTEPSLYLQSYRTVMGDIRQNDVMDYKVFAQEEGDYAFEIRYTTGPYNEEFSQKIVSVNVSVNGNTEIENAVLPRTDTKWAAFTPYKIGTIHLDKGENTVSIKNLRNGFSYDNFKLIKQ